MGKVDWDRMRALAYVMDIETPPHWPKDVRPITAEGTMLIGLDRQHRLYWDGQPVEVRRGLTIWQSIGAVAVVIAAVVGALAGSVQAYVAWLGS